MGKPISKQKQKNTRSLCKVWCTHKLDVIKFRQSKQDGNEQKKTNEMVHVYYFLKRFSVPSELVITKSLDHVWPFVLTSCVVVLFCFVFFLLSIYCWLSLPRNLLCFIFNEIVCDLHQTGNNNGEKWNWFRAPDMVQHISSKACKIACTYEICVHFE